MNKAARIALLLFAFAFSASMALSAERPNVVFIISDDQGYPDLGCIGNKPLITPNLDKLATQGMRFTDAHTAAAVCTPTRYAILTGRYAWRSPLKRGVIEPWGKPIIAPDRLTAASLLKQHGYATAAIGKWHLGHKDVFQPPSRGFDEFFGFWARDEGAGVAEEFTAHEFGGAEQMLERLAFAAALHEIAHLLHHARRGHDNQGVQALVGHHPQHFVV